MDINTKFILGIDELKEVNFPLDELFELQVNYNNIKYEFLIRLSSTNNNLVCFGSGAYNPKKFPLPIFNRHNWHIYFEESVIYYNDPTLYNDPKLTLGWGVGKNEEWYLLKIADIISVLSNKMRIKSENIVFFGSSGGGFTSIILATLFKKSKAIVNNPQIFCKELEFHFDNMVNTCFDNLDHESVLTQYGYKVDAIEMFKREKYMPSIIYLINVNSKRDVIGQLTPFMASLTSLEYFNDQLTVLLYSDDDGHDGMFEKEKTVKLIKDQFKDEINIDEIKHENKLLQNRINANKQYIADIQPIRGYLKYKTRNIIDRSKKRMKIS